MSRNLDSALVRRGHRRRQLGWSDVHVSLEVIDAFVEPEIDGGSGIVRPGQLMHLQGPGAGALEVGSGDVNFRTGHGARVDLFLDLQVGVRFERARRANRGYAGRQIQPGKTEGHLADDAVPDWIEKVIMHSHQARNDAVAAQFQNPRRLRDLRGGRGRHRFNPAFATEISVIEPLPHQRIAVYDHMIQQPRLRFLLADDEGAGKTIMTGLYIREMLTRRLILRVLIVPPAGLVGNWEHEMHNLFNLQDH